MNTMLRILSALWGFSFLASPSTFADPTGDAPPDFSWLNGNSRQSEFPLHTEPFTGQFQVDTNYVYDVSRPKDHSLVGSTNSGRASEIQLQQLGIGGDFHYKNVRGRLMTQFGMYSTMTPRNDASPSRGQWNLGEAYRYLSEAYGGYHLDLLDGLNIDAGIFMSYIGLCSYYNYENWGYQPSYVSANTPFFFNGLRAQLIINPEFKIEFWLINGWQAYGMYNELPGFGVSLLYRPTEAWSLVSNTYSGNDTLGRGGRLRVHTDNSVQHKYYEKRGGGLSKGAFSLTLDAGCEGGDGTSCGGGSAANPSQYFLGFMAYNRLWFSNDTFGLTVGGGAITNPGRYLVLIPSINGATAASGSPYFSANPGDPFKAWDTSITFDYMPSEFITWRMEYNHREVNTPYFAGRGGITPPGGNTSDPTSTVPGWSPDLDKVENRLTFAMLVRL